MFQVPFNVNNKIEYLKCVLFLEASLLHLLTVALYSHHHKYGTSNVPADENKYACQIFHDHFLFLFSAGDFDF